MKRPAPALISIALVSAAFAGCVDTSEIDYHAPASTRVDAGAPGDGGPVADGALVAACRDCVTGPTCAASYGACTKDATCSTFIGCLLDRYCLNYSVNDLAHLSPCLLECAAAAGITTQDDPAVPVIGKVLTCGTDGAQCGPLCTVGKK